MKELQNQLEQRDTEIKKLKQLLESEQTKSKDLERSVRERDEQISQLASMQMSQSSLLNKTNFLKLDDSTNSPLAPDHHAADVPKDASVDDKHERNVQEFPVL